MPASSSRMACASVRGQPSSTKPRLPTSSDEVAAFKQAVMSTSDSSCPAWSLSTMTERSCSKPCARIGVADITLLTTEAGVRRRADVSNARRRATAVLPAAGGPITKVRMGAARGGTADRMNPRGWRRNCWRFSSLLHKYTKSRYTTGKVPLSELSARDFGESFSTSSPSLCLPRRGSATGRCPFTSACAASTGQMPKKRDNVFLSPTSSACAVCGVTATASERMESR
mmetsp:Transcript_34534/g.89454  ORF Transcript_34534/g.89454 Transcript_34534/m.89454 type:complete len:228 (-) Transcript_34534:890-1573(-)